MVQTQTEPILKLENITKSFAHTPVLNHLTLTAQPGEFITLLGPSGCGKTTTLRIIAGLELPDTGTVLLEGQDVTMLPPNRRDVNTVFQNYALFPHMDIYSNIAYGLKLKRVPKAQIREKVKNMLQLVQLEDFAERMPNQLSGGQRQRVAIARAVVNEPKVLLLDEPLGALDLNLRRQMQTELKQLQKQLGLTFIYITHDQEEALNMSDRIGVMHQGNLEQLASSFEIYNFPKTSYVASFVGSANIIEATLKSVYQNVVVFENENGVGSATLQEGQTLGSNSNIRVAIRGEYISLESEKPDSTQPSFQATVIDRSFLAGNLEVTLKLKDGTHMVSTHHLLDCPIEIGDVVFATWNPAKAVLVDLEEGR